VSGTDQPTGGNEPWPPTGRSSDGEPAEEEPLTLGEPPPGEPSAPGEPPADAATGRSRPRHHRRRRLVLAVLGVVVLVLVAVVAWYEIEAHPLGGPGARVLVQVKPGEATDTVAGALERRGVVGSSLAFRLSLLFHGLPIIEPGGYVLRTNESFSTVRSILSGGPDVYLVDVLPGYTLAELANVLGDIPGSISNGFLAEAKSGAVRSPFEAAGSDNLEGLLGTGTYQVLPGETARQLLTQMVDRFDAQAAAAGLTTAAAAKLGMTPYQVVTVASIAQKEGYLDKYMGKVARVIYNRLADGTPLAMTSTVLYSLGQDGGPVTRTDQKLDTPYNTYLHAGLTPTPICFSSEAALAAAVSPPPGPWLYFETVSKAGTTLFTDTYQQQLANEKLGESRGVG
jgi:UPF0755 protein